MCKRNEHGAVEFCEEANDPLWEGFESKYETPWFVFDKDGHLQPIYERDANPSYLIKGPGGLSACNAERCADCGQIECVRPGCEVHDHCRPAPIADDKEKGE